MPNSLPILTFHIDEDKLRRLEQVAKQFADAFKMMPSGKINTEKLNTAPSENKSSTAASPTNGTPPKGWDKFFDNWQKGLKSTGKALTRVNKALKETTRVASGLFSTALSWGTKLAAFSAIGTGGFGLLASRAGQSLTSAQGLGISRAEQQAANVTYGGRISGINGILSDLNAAKYDVNSPTRRFLQSNGIDYTKSPAENLPAFLNAVEKILSQHKDAGAGLTAVQAYGANINSTQASQINFNRELLPLLAKQFQSNSNMFGTQLPDTTLRNYQVVSSHFEKNAYTISNAFLTTLERLTPGLTKFSDAITAGITKFISGPNGKELFNTIGKGLESLAKWLGSEKFQTDLKNFVELISNFVKAIANVVSWIAKVFGNSQRQMTNISTSKPIDPYYQYVWSPQARKEINQKPFFLRDSAKEYFDYLTRVTKPKNNTPEPYREFSKYDNPISFISGKNTTQRLEIIWNEKPGSDFNLQLQGQNAYQIPY